MTTCLVAFLLAFLMAVIATLGVRVLALRLGVVDKPDQFRKIHVREVPRLGGIAIFVAFAALIAGMYFFHRNLVTDLLHRNPVELLALMAGAAGALVLGAADDVWSVRARWKLLFEIMVATIAFAGGFAINTVSNPFGAPIHLGLFSFPVTLFWFLGCMNAVNLLDGLDGLAAGVCLFVTLTLFLVSLVFGNVYSMLLMACLSGAILGFLIFNFHPAKIFLGDAGSLLLGFLVAALSIMGSRKAEAAVALFIPFVALGLPIFDTSLAILRRWSRNLPIAAPDRGHIHHVLVSMGLTHKRAVLVLYGACVALGGVAVLMTMSRNEVSVFLLGSLAIIAFVCVRVFGGMRLTDLWMRLKEDLEHRQLSADARVSVEKAVIRMRTCAETRELWEAFSSALQSLGLDYASLRLYGLGGAQPMELTWLHSNGDEAAGSNTESDTWFAKLKLQNNGHVLGELKVGKAVHVEHLLADTPQLVDRLRREMAAQIERLSSTRDNG